MVADFVRIDLRADLFDDAGRLMTQDHRQRIAQRAAYDFEIGMANAGGVDADHYVARRGIADGNALNDNRCSRLVQHGGTVFRAHGDAFQWKVS